MRDADEPGDSRGEGDDERTVEGDTFGVGIGVTEDNLEFLVQVPSDIDAGWTDPDAFQGLVEEVVWRHLDQRTVLGTVASSVPAGERVSLGTVTLRPDGTVVDHTLSPPSVES